MKPRVLFQGPSRITKSFAVAAALLTAAHSAQAAAGAWTKITNGDASGTWNNATTENWLNNIVADGSGFNAAFDTLNITADSTITLGEPRTISSLTFGDTTIASAAGWELSNGGTSENKLTLAGTTPTITANALGTGKSVTISAGILGTQGLTKAGVGTLILSGENSYTGGTTISAGNLVINAGALPPTGNVTVTGTLYATGAHSTVSGWLGRIATSSPGTLALTDNSSENIDLTGFNSLRLGATTNVNYTGQLTPAGTTYRLGGGGGTLTLANTNALTGARSVVISGNTVLSGSNDFSGNINLSGGTLSLNSNNASGTGSMTVGAARTINNTSGAKITLSNSSYSWNGDLTVASSVTAAASAIDFGTGGVTLNKGSNLLITLSADVTIGGVISGTSVNSFQKSGNGTLTLTGLNTFTGGLTVSAGRVNINNGGNGTASSVGTERLTINNDRAIGNTSGSSITLTTNNPITLFGGGGGNFSFLGPDNLNLGNGAVSLGGSAASTRSWTISNATLTLGGAISEPLNVATGIMKLGNGTLVLSGANAYTGSTTVRAGTLVAGNSSAFGNATSAIAVGDSGTAAGDSATLLIDGARTLSRNISANNNSSSNSGAVTIGGTNPTSTSAIFSGNVTLNRNVSLTSLNSGATTEFSGIISQSGGTRTVSINGGSNAGTVSLTAGNTYGGTTTVNSGTLLANNTTGSATGSGSVVVKNTATLGGNGIVSGAITIESGAKLNPSGTFTSGGGVTGSGVLEIDIQGASADKLACNGSSAINISSLSLDLSGTATQPAYVIVDSAAAISGAAFASVTGIPSGYTLQYGYNDGTDSNNIALVSSGQPPQTPFQTWSSGFALQGAAAETGADPDADGIINLLEFLIGGNPTESSGSQLPTVSGTETHLVFTFRRSDLAMTQTGLSAGVEYGSDLAGWSNAANGVDGITISVTNDDFGSGVDKVEASIPRSLAQSGKLFARLKVTLP